MLGESSMLLEQLAVDGENRNRDSASRVSFYQQSRISREGPSWAFLRATSKRFSFDIFSALLILLFNTLFPGSTLQEEHSTPGSAPPGQPL